jgi:hypothetical protein
MKELQENHFMNGSFLWGIERKYVVVIEKQLVHL